MSTICRATIAVHPSQSSGRRTPPAAAAAGRRGGGSRLDEVVTVISHASTFGHCVCLISSEVLRLHTVVGPVDTISWRERCRSFRNYLWCSPTYIYYIVFLKKAGVMTGVVTCAMRR
jgi:hypothetical protein